MVLGELSWTEWIGIFGCFTGVTALSVQYLQFMHAKPRLRIEVKPECFIPDMPEFHIQDDEDPDKGSIRPATYVVITNIGQMSGAVMGISIAALKYKWYQRFLRTCFSFYNGHLGAYSSSRPFLKETKPAPFILDAGHVWIGIADTDNFRRAMDNYPLVYLEIKTSYKKQIIRKRIKLTH